MTEIEDELMKKIKPIVKKPVRPAAKPRVVPPKPGAKPKVIARPAVPVPAPVLKVIAEHTVKNDDTLSAIALKYYGKATKPYWMYIYDLNKDVIGASPNVLRPGIVIKIYEKPE
mgnify:FL=1